MDEFALIERIRAQLGGDAPEWLVLGPGDDGAVVRPPAGQDIVSSIDSFLADVHFPARADAELIGYRCLMASLSDLAAMAATPAWALVALSLPEGDAGWATALARGHGRGRNCSRGTDRRRQSRGRSADHHGQRAGLGADWRHAGALRSEARRRHLPERPRRRRGGGVAASRSRCFPTWPP